MPADIEIDRVSTAAIDAASLAQALADDVEAIAMCDSEPRSGLLNLAASAQGAAAHARMAAAAADAATRAVGCLDAVEEPTLVASELDRAGRLLGIVRYMLDAVIQMHGEVCVGLANIAAVGDDHGVSLASMLEDCVRRTGASAVRGLADEPG